MMPHSPPLLAVCTCREPGHMLAVGPDELLSKVTAYLEETVQVCVCVWVVGASQ